MAGRPRQFDESEALSAATQVFWGKGYEAVGVRELLDAMGMCRQSFYDTFGDKRGLFLRAIEQYASDAEGSFRTTLEAPGSPAANLRTLLEGKAKMASSGDCRGCFAMNTIVEWGAEDDEVAKVVKRMMRRLEAITRETLERARDAGELAVGEDLDTLAQLILFVCLGYAALGRLKISRAMADGVLRATLRGIGAS